MISLRLSEQAPLPGRCSVHLSRCTHVVDHDIPAPQAYCVPLSVCRVVEGDSIEVSIRSPPELILASTATPPVAHSRRWVCEIPSLLTFLTWNL